MLVVLLRGLNVGGHRHIRPTMLAKQLKHLDAVNIGAAGTFVIRQTVGRAQLRAQDARRLPFDAEIVICEGREIVRLMSQDHFAGQPLQSDIVRFVSVLSRIPRSAPRLPMKLPSRGEWLLQVVARDGRFVVAGPCGIAFRGNSRFFPRRRGKPVVMIRGMIDPDGLRQLLSAVQAGQRPAFDRLLARIRPSVEQLCRAALCGSDGEALSASDLMQDVTVRVWQRIAQFDGADNDAGTAATLYEWLGQIVRNTALNLQAARNAQRRRPAGPIMPLDAHETDDWPGSAKRREPIGNGPTPSGAASQAEQAQRVRTAIERMPDPVERQVVQLSFFEGYSLRAIADKLGISYDVVRERFHGGLEFLQGELSDGSTNAR